MKISKLWILIGFWFLIWGFFNLAGVLEYNDFFTTSFYFIVASLILLLFYKREIQEIVEFRNIFIGFVAVGMFCIILLSFLVYFENGDGYFISKAFDVLFQQIWILSMLGILAVKRKIFLFPLIFVIIHLPIFFVFPRAASLLIIFASIAGSILFPQIILKVKKGYVYSYLIHYMFYASAPIFVALGN